MIITAEGYRPAKGTRYRSRRVTLPDFEAFSAVQEDPAPDLRNRRFRAILSYGLEHCLTRRQQEVVDAYYLQGKKLETIARELGVAPSTVCRHLQAARRRLRALAEQAEELRRSQREIPGP